MPSAAPDEQERRWPRAGGSRALAERGRQGARQGQEQSLAMPERSNRRRYVPSAGRSTHAQMTARSEAWAGALATLAGGGRDLEKTGEREREEQCLL